MTYAVAVDSTEEVPKPGDFAPDESVFLAKRESKEEAQKWVEANRKRIAVIIGDCSIFYTTNRGKVLK